MADSVLSAQPSRISAAALARGTLPWFAVALCLTYSAFAVVLAAVEVLSWLDVVTSARKRTAPPVFVVHALAGAVALASGSVQLAAARRWVASAAGAHRVLGRLYVGAAWTASVASLVVAVLFDVPPAARAAFAAGAILWFLTTTVAFLHISNRRVEQHRAWMARSFSLSFFFVTGSLWMPVMAATGLPHAVGYPVSIVLGWSLNLAAAEWWLRRPHR